MHAVESWRHLEAKHSSYYLILGGRGRQILNNTSKKVTDEKKASFETNFKTNEVFPFSTKLFLVAIFSRHFVLCGSVNEVWTYLLDKQFPPSKPQSSQKLVLK